MHKKKQGKSEQKKKKARKSKKAKDWRVRKFITKIHVCLVFRACILFLRCFRASVLQYRENRISRASAGIFFGQSRGDFTVKNVW